MPGDRPNDKAAQMDRADGDRSVSRPWLPRAAGAFLLVSMGLVSTGPGGGPIIAPRPEALAVAVRPVALAAAGEGRRARAALRLPPMTVAASIA